MREYKFRGKRIDNSEWIYGCLVTTSPDEAFILIGITGHIKRDDYECYMVEVVPVTVGQWTGLKDKNGKDIYEEDIVLWDGRKAIIEWLPRMAGWFAMWRGEGVHFHDQQPIIPEHGGLRHIEIIGNIHDNPELLTSPAGSPALNNMNTNIDPGKKQDEQANEQVTEQESAGAAVESAAQDQAMEANENAEEGGSEG